MKISTITSLCVLTLGLSVLLAGNADTQAAPANKAAAAERQGVRNVSPEAKAAIARIKTLIGAAKSAEYESTITFPDPSANGGSTSAHIVATIGIPDLASLTVDPGAKSEVRAIIGPTASGIYNSGVKKYAEVGSKLSLESFGQAASHIGAAALAQELELTVSSFFNNDGFCIADSIPATGDLTMTAKPVTVEGRSLTDIAQIGKVQGQSITIHVWVDPNTGLPVRTSLAEGANGRDVTMFKETFKSLTLSDQAPADSSFDFKAPDSAEKVEISRADLGLASLAPGTAAPDFKVVGTDGAPTKLSKYAGKVVVIDFWATWCPPCQASLPGLNKIAKEYMPKGVVFLPVCTSDKKSAFQAWTNDRKSWALHFYFDPNVETNQISNTLYGVTGIPTQYVVGADGKIIDGFVGYGGEPSEIKLKSTLDRALSAAVAK